MDWGSSFLGRLATSARRWTLQLRDRTFTLKVGEETYVGDVLQLEAMSVIPGIFWSRVELSGIGKSRLTLDGVPNHQGNNMRRAVAVVVAHRRRVATLIEKFRAAMDLVHDWASHTQTSCNAQLQRCGWLSHEFQELIESSKPKGIEALLAIPEVAEELARANKEVLAAFNYWQSPFPEKADAINRQHLCRELVQSRHFFETVEKSPLSPEQAEAVVNFDNRVLLVAAAGSGKTSTMVAKAAYALHKNYFAADRILLLAFNNDAAAELRARLKARLTTLDLPAESVAAKTFHAFGLEVIGAATGKKPSLAPWVETGRDQVALMEIVDELKDSDPRFRTTWDLFRLVFGQDLPEFGTEEQDPESWDKASGRSGFWTLKGDVVKSRGELLIANWLFYMGVQYVYEGPYQVDVADPTHRQYRPDFYFPDIDVYLEHWAIDERGEPPASFQGYKESMAWKRRIHELNKTTLLQTTMAQLWSGQAFKYLGDELTARGLVLDPNPSREVTGRQPIENPRLLRTMRSFLTHAKSNRLTVADLRTRLQAGVAGRFQFRHRMFLHLFEQVWARWEQRLRAERCIDFDDMLNMAADCIEQGRWKSPYDLVMVDEVQDASQARARLVKALTNGPAKHLFAVGDDWQSINRFAGADLSVMTRFDTLFGKAVTLKLETTFRCPQTLCDISSRFVQKNPNQLRKRVRSSVEDVPNPVQIIRVNDERLIRSAVENRVSMLASNHPSHARPLNILVLGRYNHESGYLPDASRWDPKHLTLGFMTVHSSKGLEADHVIVPRLTSDTMGFPSGIVDDPVLHLAMPGGDEFAHAEERRLFYVALTRARREVTLITVTHKESSFITELVREQGLKVFNADGEEDSREVCPTCGNGYLTRRKGPYGHFMGCSNFPKCKFTSKPS